MTALAGLAVLAAAVGGATPAEAGLAICNKTQTAVFIALGRHNGRDWLSEGWWKIAPGSCGSVVQGPLTARYYYVRGVQEGVDGAWDSNRFLFCVKRDNFTIEGRKACHERGFAQAGFFEIDTGDNPNWTHNLSD